MKKLIPFVFVITTLLPNVHAQDTYISTDDIYETNNPSSTEVMEGRPQLNPQVPFLRSCSAPPAPATVGDQRCGSGGSVMLSATASSGGDLNWYDAATGGTLLGTGPTLSTTTSTTTNYYVEEVVTSGGGGSPTTMSTSFSSDNGQRGAMFDITATNTITITNFSSSLYAGTTADYEIYYKTGTHVGSENNAAAWTLLGSTSGLTSAGNNIPTLIPIPFSVTIPAGQTYAFYITNNFGGGVNYNNGTAVGNVWASNADMTLFEGVGKSYPFGLTFTVRSFNGIVHYNPGSGASSTCVSPRSLATAEVTTPQYTANNSTVTSNSTCTEVDGGITWTHYYNNSNPEDILFSIAHDPFNLGNNNFTAQVEIDCGTAGSYHSIEDNVAGRARYVMNRYWNVNLLSGSVVDPVYVRFYHSNAEENDMYNAALAFQGTYGGTVSPKYWFKTVGSDFDPSTDLHLGGIYNGLDLVSYVDNQTTASGVNYVELRNITSFSGGSMIVGVVQNGEPVTSNNIILPLDLNYFNADNQAKEVSLKWGTSNERSMDYFEVQRSTDALSFETLGQVTAKGLNDNVYNFIDYTPISGNSYYRIVMVEMDGTKTYSDIAAVSREEGTIGSLSCYPNPTNGHLYLDIDALETNPAKVVIYNTMGNILYTEEYSLNIGYNQLKIDQFTQLYAGSYIIEISTNESTTRRTIIKI